MPEARQIGRRSAIDGLEIGIKSMTHQWIIGPRRIGKTSVAKAVLTRLRQAGHVALDIDLSKRDFGTQKNLAGEIARQAQAAQAGIPIASRRFWRFASRQTPRARRLGKALDGFGFADQGEALEAVSSVLAGADDGAPGLAGVLEALSVHGRATGKHVVVLLDEVHRLAGLEQSDREVATWCRDGDCPIVFVFAGSEESAIRELREEGQPLASVGREFQLNDIGTEDWLRGLRLRFHEAGVQVDDSGLFAIVEASDGHPRRTMLIASYVHTKAEAQPDHHATSAVVELAIRDAQEDRAWA
jgi:DNA polymerase III delta prime subunit